MATNRPKKGDIECGCLLWEGREEAVVVLELAVWAMVVRHAVAVVGGLRVLDGHEAQGVVLARVRVALFQLQLAPVPGEPELAGAEVGAGHVHAHAAVQAGALRRALVHVRLAVGATPS